MKNIRQYIPLILVALVFGFRQLALLCTDANICSFSNFFHSIFDSLVNPPYLFLITFILPALILILVKKEVFNAWVKFAVVGIILSVLIIGTTPLYSGQAMPLYFINRYQIATYLGTAFTVISLILIAWKSFATRRDIAS